MGKISLLDVTLRDGGIVNDFNFGEENIQRIITALEDSAVKHIELGYLEKNTGTERGRSQYCNETVIEKYFLKAKKPGVEYLVMMDYGKFDVAMLQNRTEGGVDAIRLAFHKRNFHEAMPLYEEIEKKGYDIYMQPMLTIHYSDEELDELVEAANKLHIKGFYFVDTFGQMQQPEIEKLATFLDKRLRHDIALGFHSHNNIQMAFANAITFLRIPMERDKMLDASIMGMGRGAGNLNTELILSHLNQYYGGSYSIAPLLTIMDTVIGYIKNQHPWGYSVEYYLSSVNDCSPIYAGYYYNKRMLSVEKLNQLLGMLEGENRISFNKKYAEEKYRQFNGGDPFDDSRTLNELSSYFAGKSVCVLAPGKSLATEKEIIQSSVGTADISVSLNCDVYNSEFEFVTREDTYQSAVSAGKRVIVPSNVTRAYGEGTFVVDYYKWILVDDETHDSAGFIILNLLIGMGAKRILLVGFDGFDVDARKNYFNASLNKTFSLEQAESLNKAFSAFIKEKQKTHQIEFVTESIYDERDKK